MERAPTKHHFKMTRAQPEDAFFVSSPQSVPRMSRISRLAPLIPHSGLLTPTQFAQQFQALAKPGLFRGLISPQESDSTKSTSFDSVRWTAFNTWSELDADGKETLGGMRRPDTEHIMVPVEVSPANTGYNAKGNQQGQQWSRISIPFGEQNVFH